MKQRYHYFRRENHIYYSLDTLTKKRNSLNTTELEEARRLVNALNEACQQPAINLQIAQVYLQHSDPDFAKRTWQHVMNEMGKTKFGNTKKRWDVAMKDKSFDLVRGVTMFRSAVSMPRASHPRPRSPKWVHELGHPFFNSLSALGRGSG
jgi:hypothetical protein